MNAPPAAHTDGPPRAGTTGIKADDPGTLRAGGGRFGWVRWLCARFWVWYLMWNAQHWPWYARAAKPFYVWWAWKTSRSMRQGTLANARRVLGPASLSTQQEAMGKGIVGNFYEFIYEMGRNRGRTPEQIIGDVEIAEGREHYERARELKRGAIVVTAHLGSFETGVAALRTREPKVHVVFRRDEVAQFERLRSEQRRRLGVVEQPIDDGFAVWLRLREALARDEVVLLQGDRVMPGQRGVRMPFLHGHLMMPLGPVKLALTTGAPIVPVFSARSVPGRVRIYTEPPIIVEQGDPDEGGVHPALHRLARVIEKYVARFPDQWLMVNPVFCEDTEPARARTERARA